MTNNGQLYLVVFEICSRTRYRGVPLPNYKLVALLASASINLVRANLPNCLSDASVSVSELCIFHGSVLLQNTRDFYECLVSVSFSAWSTVYNRFFKCTANWSPAVLLSSNKAFTILFYTMRPCNTILEQETSKFKRWNPFFSFDASISLIYWNSITEDHLSSKPFPRILFTV